MILYITSSCLLLLTSAILINRFGLSKPLENWVSLVVLSFSEVILTTSFLSIFWRIDVWPFLAVQLVLGIFALPFIRGFDRGKWQIRPGWMVADRLLFFTLLGVLFFLCLNLLLTLYVPPNTYDSMTYHLARIGYWMQHQSLEHFYTPNIRQTTFPFNAEILMMHSLLFLKQDFLAGLVQYISYLGSAAVVYLISRFLAFSKESSTFAACLLLSLPAINLQSTSTQNDLTTAFFMSSAFYFLMVYTRDKRTYHLFLAALSLGCGLGTKTYGFFLLPSMGIYLLLKKATIRDLLKTGGLFCVTFLLLAGYCHLLNQRHYKNPFGEPFTISVIRSDFKPSTFKDTLVKSTFDFVDFFPFYLDVPVLGELPAIRETLVKKLTHVFKVEQNTLYAYSPKTRVTVNEDTTWYGLLGFTLLPAGLIAGFFWGDKERKAYAALVFMHFLVFSYFMLWQPFLGRFLVLSVLLWVPLSGFIFNFRKTALVVALIMMASFSTVALFNKRKPLISALGQKSILCLNRDQMRSLGENPGGYFKDTHHEAFNRTFAAEQGHRIGLVTTGNYWEYPLFGKRFENELVHLSVDDEISGFDYVVVQKWQSPENQEFIKKNDLVETGMSGIYRERQ